MGQVVERWGKYSKVDVQILFQNILIKNHFLYFVCILCCKKLVNNYNLVFLNF